MDKKNVVVAIFDCHKEAEVSLRELKEASFDLKRVSIVAQDYHTHQHAAGYYNTHQRMLYWGKFGTFWGLWGSLFGSAFFFLIPDVGPIVVSGHLVSFILVALRTANLGGLSALGFGLRNLGIPVGDVLDYEKAIRSCRFIMVMRGTAEETLRAKSILDRSESAVVNCHGHQGSLSGARPRISQPLTALAS